MPPYSYVLHFTALFNFFSLWNNLDSEVTETLKFLGSVYPASSDGNVLYNRSTVIKTRKLTLANFLPAPLVCVCVCVCVCVIL